MTPTEEQLRALLLRKEIKERELSATEALIQATAADHWRELYGLHVGALIRDGKGRVYRVELLERWIDWTRAPLLKCSPWLDRQGRWSQQRQTFYPATNFGAEYAPLSPEEAEAFLSTHQEKTK